MPPPWNDAKMDADSLLEEGGPLSKLTDGMILEVMLHDWDGNDSGRALVAISHCRNVNDNGVGRAGHYVHVEDEEYAKYVRENGVEVSPLHLCQRDATKCKAPLPGCHGLHVSRWRIISKVDLDSQSLRWIPRKGKALAEGYFESRRGGEGMGSTPTGVVDHRSVENWLADIGGSAQEAGDLKRALEASVGETFPPKKIKSGRSDAFAEAMASSGSGGPSAPVSQGLGAPTRNVLTPEASSEKDGSTKSQFLKFLQKVMKSEDFVESDDEQVFHEAPPRNSQSALIRLSKKCPGRLALDGLKRMDSILGYRRGGTANNQVPQVALAFFFQIIFPRYGTGPEANRARRDMREYQTLCTILEALGRNELGSASDLIMQRLKALEKKMQDGNWNEAQHFELIPSQSTGLVERDEEHMVRREARLDQRMQEPTRSVHLNSMRDTETGTKEQPQWKNWQKKR